MGRSDKQRERDELIRQVGDYYYLDGWKSKEIMEEFAITYRELNSLLKAARARYAARAISVTEQARTLMAEQLLETSTAALESFKKTRAPEYAAVVIRTFEAMNKENASPPAPKQTINIQNNTSATAAIIEVQETEDWYGEHGVRAHKQQQPNHASFTEAVAAHQRRLVESGQVQNGMLRPPMGKDGHEHAGDTEGPRASEGLLAGGIIEAGGQVPLAGDDTRTSEACYLGIDGEGNPIYHAEEE